MSMWTIEWFKTLPLFYETKDFRAVHACWDNEHIEYLRSVLDGDTLSDSILYESVHKGTRLYTAIEDTLKGREVKMPEGRSFRDKDGHVRREIRVMWWKDPVAKTYRDLVIPPDNDLPDEVVPESQLKTKSYYCEATPVFFGHYWLTGEPEIFTKSICCLDYSVANQGKLVAYQFDGELSLDNSKLKVV